MSDIQKYDPTVMTRLGQIHELLGTLTSSPHAHDLIELVLATATSLPLCQVDHAAPIWLMVEGNPSSGKTDAVFTLKGVSSVFALDTLTENSWISGYVEDVVPGKKRKSHKTQLIDELNGKTLVIKDLTTLLSSRDDKVKKILGDLQSIYDGEYAKATGTVGVIRSKSVFAMIACVTPAAMRRHRHYMSMIGGRFLTFKLPPLTDAERQEGFARSWDEMEKERNLQALKDAMRQHISELLSAPVDLDVESSDIKHALNDLASLLARGRGIVLTEKVSELDETTGAERYSYETVQPQIEEPFRAVQQLRTLARASARVHGRRNVIQHDIELVRRVVFGSMLNDRSEALMCFPRYKLSMPRAAFQQALKKSESGTRQLLEQMVALRLIEREVIQAETSYKPIQDLTAVISKPIEMLGHLLKEGGHEAA